MNRLPRGLAPLRQLGFRRLIAGSLASNLGNSFYAVALPWYVLAEHGGALLLGTVLAVYGTARAAALLAGGPLSDRLDPWTVMMGADLTRALAVAGLAAVAALGPARAGLLIPIAVVVGAGGGVFMPGSFSIVPALLPDADLQAGNALAATAQELSGLAVPLGGVLVAFAGPAAAIAVDAASFLASALALAAVRRAPHPGQAEAAVRAADADADPDADPDLPTVRRMLRTDRVLAIILVINVAANLGMGGMSEVALPALAHGPFHAGAAGYGLMLAAFGVGAVLGTLGAAAAGRLRHPAFVASFAFLAEAGFMAAIPYLGGAAPAAGALLGFGLLNGFANVLTLTAIQRWCPRGLLGRLMSLTLLASVGIFPVSVLLGGIVVHADGPAIFFPLAGATVAVAVLGALSQREWREFGVAVAA